MPSKKINKLSKNADQFYAKCFFNGKNRFFQIDSGSPISLVPIQLLSEMQKNNLCNSDIGIEAYGYGKINNLGILKLDLHLESLDNRTVILRNQSFFVTSSSMTPILGNDILFAGDENLHIIDKVGEMAIIGGEKVKIYESIRPKAKIVSDIKIVRMDKLPVFAKMDTVIGPNTESIIPVYMKTKPHNATFLVEPQILNRFSVGGGLYNKSQFQNFPMRIYNASDKPVKLKINTKLCPAFLQAGNEYENVKQVRSINKVNIGDRVSKIWDEIEFGDLDDHDRSEINRILHRFHDRFMLRGELPGKSKLPHFDVHLKNEAPIASQSYRTSFPLRAKLKDILDGNIKNGLMERGSSPWNSPTLLVKKPSGDYRLVCDFRRVNEIIEPDNYPLPKISDLLVRLHGSKFFVQTDLCQGFHQIGLTERAKNVLSVGNEFGQFQYNRMPMGVRTAPSFFQRSMDNTFEELSPESQLCYVDDLVNPGNNKGECLRNWESSLLKMEEKDLKVAACKTRVLVCQIKFCGHIVKNGVLSICTDRVEAVKLIKTPNSKKEAQSVYGFFNYLRIFIKNFARISKPISDTFRGFRFKWSDEAQNALEKLKALLVSRTLSLKIPDVNLDEFVLETDASDFGCGGCLYVCTGKHGEDDHGPHCLTPVEFYSENFTDAQVRKYIREKELLAFRNSLAKFKVYLLGKKFTWYTDNNSLKWANSLKTSKDRIARILAEVGEFHYDIQIKRSNDLKVTDFLSRSQPVNSLKITGLDFASLQKNDPVLSKIMNFVKIQRWPNDFKVSEEEKYWKRFRGLIMLNTDGCLVFTNQNLDKLIVPESMRNELIEAYHDFSGHPGADNTIVTLGKCYTWYNMKDDIRNYVKFCDKCQREKPNLRPKIPPPCVTDTPNGPFEKISCDLTGPLPITDRENIYILVVNDHFSKKVSTRPLSCKHSWEVLRAFKEIIHENPRLPKVVLTDNGGEFMGSFDIFLSAKKIKHVRTSPYYPKSNGVTERMNQTLKNRLQPHKNTSDWDLLLPEVTQLINLCPNEATQYSPFVVETGLDGDHPYNPVDFASSGTKDLFKIRNEIFCRQDREKRGRAGDHLKLNFSGYNVNDRVLIKARKGPDRYTGPFTIIKTLAEGRSFVLKNENGATFVRRSEELKPYYENVPENVATNNNNEKAEADDGDDFNFLFFSKNNLLNFSNNSFMNQTPPHSNSISPLPEDVPEFPSHVVQLPVPSVPVSPSRSVTPVNSPVSVVHGESAKKSEIDKNSKVDSPNVSTQVVANPDSENSTSSVSSDGAYDDSDTDLSEISEDEDENTGEQSWMEISSTTANAHFTAPDMLNKDDLKNHIINDVYTRCDFLYKFKLRSEIKDIIRTYNIRGSARLLVNKRDNIDQIRKYLLEKHSDLPVRIVKGVAWPKITVNLHYHREQARPEKETIGRDMSGWCVEDLNYRQLLMLAYWKDILIPVACLNNRDLVLRRILSAITNMDNIFTYYYDRRTYILDDND